MQTEVATSAIATTCSVWDALCMVQLLQMPAQLHQLHCEALLRTQARQSISTSEGPSTALDRAVCCGMSWSDHIECAVQSDLGRLLVGGLRLVSWPVQLNALCAVFLGLV